MAGDALRWVPTLTVNFFKWPKRRNSQNAKIGAAVSTPCVVRRVSDRNQASVFLVEEGQARSFRGGRKTVRGRLKNERWWRHGDITLASAAAPLSWKWSRRSCT